MPTALISASHHGVSLKSAVGFSVMGSAAATPYAVRPRLMPHHPS